MLKWRFSVLSLPFDQWFSLGAKNGILCRILCPYHFYLLILGFKYYPGRRKISLSNERNNANQIWSKFRSIVSVGHHISNSAAAPSRSSAHNRTAAATSDWSCGWCEFADRVSTGIHCSNSSDRCEQSLLSARCRF